MLTTKATSLLRLCHSSVLRTVLCRTFSDRSLSEKMGVPPDILGFLQQDIDLRPSSVKRWVDKQKWKDLQRRHEYNKEVVSKLGHDLAAAKLIIEHDGAVKFKTVDKWYRKNKDGRGFVPKKYSKNFYVEAIDASNTSVMYSSFEYFDNLSSLKLLNLSQCPNVDDWCLARLYTLSDTLRFLDLTGCPRVSERGLATLHNLQNLEGLKIADMPNVQNPELIAIYLEEALPNCRIIGVDYSQTQKTNLSVKSNPETLLQWVAQL